MCPSFSLTDVIITWKSFFFFCLLMMAAINSLILYFIFFSFELMRVCNTSPPLLTRRRFTRTATSLLSFVLHLKLASRTADFFPCLLRRIGKTQNKERGLRDEGDFISGRRRWWGFCPSLFRAGESSWSVLLAQFPPVARLSKCKGRK